MRRTPQVDDIILLPGRYFIGDCSCRVQTTLGSGVAITLWHRAGRIGAMAHFLPAPDGTAIPLKLDGHNAWDGLQLVLNGLRGSQIDPAECVVRICGSGDMLSRTDRVPSLNTGQAGGECARRLMRACGLPIVAERFYSTSRHQIIFDVSTGRVQARRIKPVVVAIDALPKPGAKSISPALQGGTARSARAR